MAYYGGGGGDEKKPLKQKKMCNPSVDDCTSGAKAPKTRSRVSLSKFNPNAKRYNLPTGKKKKEEKSEYEGGGHMNMRDLSGTPGYMSSEQATASKRNPEEAKKAEITLRKNRLRLKK